MERVFFLVLLLPPAYFYFTHRLARTGLFSPFHSFWIAYFGMLIVQPLVEYEYFETLLGPAVILKTVLMGFVAGIGVVVGAAMPAASRYAKRLPRFVVEPIPRDFCWIGLTLIFIGVLAQLYVAFAVGGLDVLMGQARLSVTSDVSAYLYVLPDVAILGCLFLMIWRYRTGSLQSVVISTVLWFTCTVWYCYIGSRSRFMILVVYLVVAKYCAGPGMVLGRMRRVPFMLVAALFFLVPSMGLIGKYREYFYGGSVHFDVSNADPIEMLVGGMEVYQAFDSDGQAKTATEYLMIGKVAELVPFSVAYDFGYMLLEIVTRAIPRQLWQDKIYPDSESWDRFHRVAETTKSINSAGFLAGPATPLPAKWFYMLGWPGLIIGGLYTGFLLRVIQEYVWRYDTLMGSVFSGIFFMVGFAEMNNPFTWQYVVIPFLLLPTILLVTIVSGIRRRQGNRNRTFRGEQILHPKFAPSVRGTQI